MGVVTFNEDGSWAIKPWGDVFAEMRAEDERQARLHPSDPEHRKMFCYSGDDEVEIYWGGYRYSYDLAQIERPEDLLWMIHHLTQKQWPGMTAKRVGLLIAGISQRKGWPLYGCVPLPHEMPKPSDPKGEREKMTQAIRYRVLTRDGHRCRCCGATVSTGAVLHIDHIVPVSKGGLTEIRNLQTLCAACNFGKRDMA